MGLKFVHKRISPRRPSGTLVLVPVAEQKETKKAPVKTATPKNKTVKKNNDMTTMEQIAAAEVAVEAMTPEVKVVKKDRGLIERTESSKIILTEDNRQVLND